MTNAGILSERTVSFAEAAELCPSVGGKKPSTKSVLRWANKGLLVNGARVQLECARRGGIRVTSVEALNRFFAAINGGDEPRQQVRTPAARQSASEAALARLRKRFQKS